MDVVARKISTMATVKGGSVSICPYRAGVKQISMLFIKYSYGVKIINYFRLQRSLKVISEIGEIKIQN